MSLKVSLVVPLRDEEATLPVLIDSIRRQTHPPDEVVLVDGGSIDQTVELARRLGAGDDRFKVIETDEATPGRGRNVGIAAARNQWIALADAGLRLEPTWLERLVEVAKSHPHPGVVYGNYEPISDSFFDRCAALSYVAVKRERNGRRMRGPSTASWMIEMNSDTAARFGHSLQDLSDYFMSFPGSTYRACKIDSETGAISPLCLPYPRIFNAAFVPAWSQQRLEKLCVIPELLAETAV